MPHTRDFFFIACKITVMNTISFTIYINLTCHSPQLWVSSSGEISISSVPLAPQIIYWHYCSSGRQHSSRHSFPVSLQIAHNFYKLYSSNLMTHYASSSQQALQRQILTCSTRNKNESLTASFNMAD